MEIKKLFKRLGIGAGLIGILLTGPVTCKSLGKGAKTKYVEYKDKNLYFYSYRDTCEYRRPLKFFKKDTCIFEGDKFLFVKNKEGIKLGDTLRVYHFYPNCVYFKLIRDSSQIFSQEDFLKGISEKRHYSYFTKKGDYKGGGITISIDKKRISKDKKKGKSLRVWEDGDFLWREKELENFKNFIDVLE